jgi:hypothetical protein
LIVCVLNFIINKSCQIISDSSVHYIARPVRLSTRVDRNSLWSAFVPLQSSVKHSNGTRARRPWSPPPELLRRTHSTPRQWTIGLQGSKNSATWGCPPSGLRPLQRLLRVPGNPPPSPRPYRYTPSPRHRSRSLVASLVPRIFSLFLSPAQ